MDLVMPLIYYFFYYTSMFGGIYLFVRILQIHVIGELKDIIYEYIIFGNLSNKKLIDDTVWLKL